MNLEWLSLQGNNISDISALAGLTSLKWLDLSSNNIVDIWGLGGLAKLEGLDLSYNNISNCTLLTVDVLANLEWLGLIGNNLAAYDEICLIEHRGVTVRG